MKENDPEREQRALDRYLDRVLRCLEAEEEADKAERRYWSTRGGDKARRMAEYERWRKLRELREKTDPESPGDELRH